MNEKFDVWDYLVERGIATDDELQLITYVAGYTDETINRVIYARTGYNDLDQLMEVMQSEQRTNTIGGILALMKLNCV